jgi:Uma2 family endonuclease
MGPDTHDTLLTSLPPGANAQWSRNDDLDRLPIIYEDEAEFDLGESNPHVMSDEILHVCLTAHFADQPQHQVFSNMNVYYSAAVKPLPYVSPDTMIVRPFRRLPEAITSYEIGRDGPPPEFVAEVLSDRSAQQRDLDEKVVLYAKLGIQEYLLVDVRGVYLPERLLLKRLQADGSWADTQDADGGVTSRLGFRVVIEADDRLRVVDLATGLRYVRPLEAQVEANARGEAEEAYREADQARQQALEAQRLAESGRLLAEEARRHAEERLRDLEAEVERLKKLIPPQP